MSRILERFHMLEKALDTFNVALIKIKNITHEDYYYTEVRDSVIQRFEYSLDTFWKYCHHLLLVKYGIDVISSPKVVFKNLLEIKVITIDDYKIIIEMIDDRNMTSHAYNVELAEKISADLPKYYETIITLLKKL